MFRQVRFWAARTCRKATMRDFLEKNAREFEFSYGIQQTASVAARLDAEGDAYAAARLTEAEAALFLSLRVQKRKIEWLAGRMAAKTAFAQYKQVESKRAPASLLPGIPTRTGQVSILNRPNRAPFLEGYPELRISISHSHEYAVAAVAAYDIGIDIERNEPRPRALASYFFCEEERRLLEEHSLLPDPRDGLITKLWSRKEALSKYLQWGGRMVFSQVNSLPDHVCLEGASNAGIRLVSGERGGYWISLALPEKGFSAHE